MTSIVFTAEGADAQAEVNGKLTAGMVGVRIRFELDEAWKGLNVIATFEGSGALISVPLLSYMEGAVPLNVQAYRVIDTDVPWEVLQKANTRLRIGLEGRLIDGTIVIPTVWAKGGYIEAGALATGEEANKPTPGIYDQIMAAINAGKLQGAPGEDGVSPVVDVVDIEGGHRVTITDKNGTQVFDVMNGKDGSDASVSIVDNLGSSDPNAALSARMGGVLKTKIEDDVSALNKQLQPQINQRVKTVNGVAPDENGNVVVQSGTGGLTKSQISALDGMFRIASFTKDPTDAYNAFKVAFGLGGSGGSDDTETEQPGEGVVQTGSILAITSGVTVSKTGSTLAIA